MGTFLQDIRYGFRVLLKSPAFAVVAWLTIALGIGANTAMFSAVNSVLLRQPPFRDPDRLVMIWEKNPAVEGFLGERLPVRLKSFLYWKDQSRSFADMTLMLGDSVNVSGVANPVRVERAGIAANFLSVMGVAPAIGRSFTANENSSDTAVAIISYGLYERQFGKAADILQRSIRLDGVDHRIVGVLPREFHLTAEWGGLDQPKPEVWTPLNMHPAARPSGEPADMQNVNTVYARLKPGVSLQQARSEMALVESRLLQQFPKEYEQFGTNLFSLYEEDVAGSLRRSLLVLQLAVGFVLLIACVNVANLLLARAAGRERETAVRLALGASRWRLMRQMLSESLVFSALGAAAGLLLAWWGITALGKLAPEDVHGLHEMTLDPRVLGFTVLVTVVAGLLFGIAPALHAAGQKLHETMNRSGRSAAGNVSRRFRSALVVAEIALALAPLAGAGLMIRTLHALNALDLGIQPERVIDGQIILPAAQYKTPDSIVAFCNQLLEKVRALPQVESAALAMGAPMQSISYSTFYVEGERSDQAKTTDIEMVGDDYFRTMGTPLLEGRSFTADEVEKKADVVVVTRSLAKRLWPNQDPINKVVIQGAKKTRLTVIGVVPDTRILVLGTEGRQVMFRPVRGMGGMALIVRARNSTAGLGPLLEQTLHSIDKDLPLHDVHPLTDVARDNIAQQRFTMVLLIAFASLALALAAIGLYGVLAYNVAQRTREIGIRMALGARAADVLQMVLRQGAVAIVAGLCIGVAGALLLVRAMASLLFGVRPYDPLTFAAVAIALGGIALLASYIPARRAAKVDPLVALRYE